MYRVYLPLIGNITFFSFFRDNKVNKSNKRINNLYVKVMKLEIEDLPPS
jgi:hypothetical protein